VKDAEQHLKTYSLSEVATMVLPDMARGERWLAQRLIRGEISGYRIGRNWRMTHTDVEDLVERHRNRPAPQPGGPVPKNDALSSLTPTSRRRLERGELGTQRGARRPSELDHLRRR
jgi:hypothetical protein